MSETRKEPPQEMTQLTDEEVKVVTGGAIVYDLDPDDAVSYTHLRAHET